MEFVYVWFACPLPVSTEATCFGVFAKLAKPLAKRLSEACFGVFEFGVLSLLNCLPASATVINRERVAVRLSLDIVALLWS